MTFSCLIYVPTYFNNYFINALWTEWQAALMTGDQLYTEPEYRRVKKGHRDVYSPRRDARVRLVGTSQTSFFLFSFLSFPFFFFFLILRRSIKGSSAGLNSSEEEMEKFWKRGFKKCSLRVQVPLFNTHAMKNTREVFIFISVGHSWILSSFLLSFLSRVLSLSLSLIRSFIVFRKLRDSYCSWKENEIFTDQVINFERKREKEKRRNIINGLDSHWTVHESTDTR